ncbi:hypothetical protein Rsub_01827 [Raphidocelis subcapitata]|uniref:Uncharacterized protein n=1 Tax=Raphidocelis subcapitata TaxID=307507 RepID=A0A2V0NU68_9CHLO|nr:hypothetical protein Rsub_01827 [Raphidocelis subcapitata]|eukprot:GBF89110.1 hypothetical protein Rsub_01827 [Raphidocelis subcapitata]
MKRTLHAQNNRKLRNGTTNFSDALLDELRAAAADAARPEPARRLAAALLAFTEAASPVAELEDLKHVISAAEAAVRGLDASDPALRAALRLLLPLLVQDRSRLLHRHLMSFARRLPEGQRAVAGGLVSELLVGACRARLAETDGEPDAAAAAAAAAAGTAAWVRPALSVSQAGASVAVLPATAGWLAPAAGPLLRLSARGAAAVIAAAEAGAPLSPAVMDQLQDTMTLIMHLLSNHGRELATAWGAVSASSSTNGNGGGSGGEDGASAVLEAADMMLFVLRGRILVRESMAGAAIGLWHAALLGGVPPAAAAAVVARGLGIGGGGGAADAAAAGARGEQWRPKALRINEQLQAEWLDKSLLERLLASRMERAAGPGAVAAARRAHGSCFAAQLARATPVGRLCALKGMIGSMPPEALCCDLSGPAARSEQLNGGSGSGNGNGGSGGGSGGSGDDDGASWGLLIDGALPLTAATLQNAADSHIRHHAACALGAALQRCRSVWAALASGDGEDGAAGQAGAGAAGAPPLLPWLRPEARSHVMGVMWNFVDEPVSQTLKQLQDAFDQMFGLVAEQAAAAGRLAPHTPAPPGCAGAEADAVLRDAAAALLRLPAGRKGRYGPLLSLLPRVGAGWMLRAEPRLLDQVLAAMSNDMIANTANCFFRGLLAQLRREAAGGGADEGAAAGAAGGGGAPDWRDTLLPPVVAALSGPDERLRSYVSMHGLVALLQAEPLLLRPLLRSLLGVDGQSSSSSGSSGSGSSGLDPGRMAAAIAVMRTGRQLQLYGDLSEIDELISDAPHAPASGAGDAASGGSGAGKGGSATRELLLLCVASSSEQLRLACLDLACGL